MPPKTILGKSWEDALYNLETFSPADKLLQDMPEPYFAEPEKMMPAGLIEFIERWHDPEFRKSYLNLKGSVGAEHQVDPATYAGFIEESPALYKDIALAAKETGVDPEFLYNVAMQEGLANKMSIRYNWNINPVRGDQKEELLYSSDETLDSFSDIGLDTIFMDQDLALGRGYLKERIVPAEKVWQEVADDEFKGVEYTKVKNEAGLMVDRARITSKDALRGVGAIIRLNKDYLKSSFEEEGLDFDTLSEKQQNFWLYSAFNAGAGNAAKLLKTYGADPYSNPKFVEKLTQEQNLSIAQNKWGDIEYLAGTQKPLDPAKPNIYDLNILDEVYPEPTTPYPEGSISLAEWMENVGRVVGGTEITDLYKPWDDELIYGDLKDGY